MKSEERGSGVVPLSMIPGAADTGCLVTLEFDQKRGTEEGVKASDTRARVHFIPAGLRMRPLAKVATLTALHEVSMAYVPLLEEQHAPDQV